LTDDKNWTPNGNQPGEPHGGLGWNLATFANVEAPKSQPFGRLIAWDPVAQREVWRQEHVSPWNGGTLTTAGNLVFQGTADGRFIAYNAKTGEMLWQTATGTGVVAAPSTYLVDGKQYVSVAVGWGGVYGLSHRASDRQSPGTVYTFALGGTAVMPDFVKYQLGSLVAGVKYDPANVQAGTMLYVNHCVFCHGVPGVDRGGNIPNLGYMDAAVIENLDKYVFGGPATDRGMPDFTKRLSREDVEKIKAFIQGTADAIRPK
jgi:quinohemoprotein ethanol dehydrogenase